jgi:DNA-binding NarL/FixJ family response regulator
MRTAHTDVMLHRPITLLVVDDNASVRRGLRYRLELETDLLVLGEAADGNEALHKLEQFDPDVVIVDVEMPVMDGLSVAATLRAEGRRARSVVLTVHDDSATRARARAASVDRFVSKTTGVESLLSAIRQVGQAA